MLGEGTGEQRPARVLGNFAWNREERRLPGLLLLLLKYSMALPAPGEEAGPGAGNAPSKPHHHKQMQKINVVYTV